LEGVKGPGKGRKKASARKNLKIRVNGKEGARFSRAQLSSSKMNTNAIQKIIELIKTPKMMKGKQKKKSNRAG
jgi:hypothetical protein